MFRGPETENAEIQRSNPDSGDYPVNSDSDKSGNRPSTPKMQLEFERGSLLDSILKSLCSQFSTCRQPVPGGQSTVADILSDIQSGKYRSLIEEARRILDWTSRINPESVSCASDLEVQEKKALSQYRKFKESRLPAVSFSGIFAKRNNAGIQKPTGLIIADIDHLAEVDRVFDMLCQDRHVVFAFRSPGGDGIKAALYSGGVSSDREHKVFFQAVQAYFLDRYSIEIDKACSDISRLTFVSWDERLHLNQNSSPFPVSAWKPSGAYQSGPESPSRPWKDRSGGKYAGKAKYAWKVILAACGRIAASASGHQHQARLTESNLVGGYLHHGIQESDALSELEAAVRESGAVDMSKAMKTIMDGIAHGKSKPIPVPDRYSSSDRYENIRQNREASNHATSDSPDGSDRYSEDKKTSFNGLPEIPMDAFHPHLQKVINEISQAKAVPREAVIAGLLALLSGLTGRARGIRLKHGWIENGNLFIALLARSGVGKSPAVDCLFKIVRKMEKVFFEIWKKEMAEYEILEARWKAEIKKKKGNPGEKPVRPSRTEILIDDSTIESVVDALSQNPKGVLWYRDELAGLFQECDRYSGKDGATESRLMQAYDSRSWKVNRVNVNRTVFIDHATLSIFGTIQPAMAKLIFQEKDITSGFVPRFNFINAIQKSPSRWTEQSESEEVNATIEKVVNALARMKPDDTDSVIKLSPEAKEKFIQFHDELALESWMGQRDNEDSLLSKLKAQCARICLCLHLVNQVLDDKYLSMDVPGQTMESAISLAQWLKAHSRMVMDILKQEADLPSGKEIRIAQAIWNLKDEIELEFLATDRILSQVNHGHAAQFHLSPQAVGRMRNKMGFEEARSKTGVRGWRVTEEDLKKCFLLLEKPSEPSEPSKPSNHATSQSDRYDFQSVNPSNPSENPSEDSGEDDIPDEVVI